MKDFAHERMKQGFAEMSIRERNMNLRNPITRGRHLDNLDWGQLPVKSSTDLTDTDGAFWFIPGVSAIGGGDKMRP
jgi:hypothetical protein